MLSDHTYFVELQKQITIKKRSSLVWLLLYFMWPDLELILQALSLLHWIQNTHSTDILWENTRTHAHRMHVIKVQISLSVCIFRTMPAWLNCPENSTLHARPVKHVVGTSNSKLITENNINEVQLLASVRLIQPAGPALQNSDPVTWSEIGTWTQQQGGKRRGGNERRKVRSFCLYTECLPSLSWSWLFWFSSSDVTLKKAGITGSVQTR